MSDLTFNKIAAAGLATAFLIAGLTQLTGGLFEQEPAKTPGYLVEVAEEGGEGAAAVDTLPDWGTVLPTADVAAGEAVFAKCKSCHVADAGNANGTGPGLHGVVGRPPASHPGFAYSDGMKGEAAKIPVWDYDHLYEFLKGPQKYVPGTKMTFVGLKKPEDRVAVIAYLKSQGGTLPIPAPDPSRAPGAAAAAAAPAAGAAPAAPGAAPAAGEKPAAADAKAPAPPASAPAAAVPAAPPKK